MCFPDYRERYKKSKPKEALIDLIYELRAYVNENVKSVLKDFDLTLLDLYVMRQIQNEPGIIISEIARRLGSSKSQIFKSVETFNQRGWINRCSDASDTRNINLFFTKIGDEKMNEIIRMLSEKTYDIFSNGNISQTQIEQMIKDLGEIKENMDKS